MHVAVVQAASVPFDSEATVAKAVELMAECGSAGAKLAVFPEAFVGGYPKGASFDTVIGHRAPAGRQLFKRYFDAAVALDGNEIRLLEDAAREHDLFTVIGIIERLGNTLYCTAVMISPESGVVGYHRKLMPTGTERIMWGFGDGSTLDVVDSPAGKLGAVICWENYMPLLRQAMYSQGIEIYCAPTADDRPTWQGTMSHIAIEGRVHVLSACQAIRVDQFPEGFEIDFTPVSENMVMRGGSVIVDPMGQVLAGPVYDQETILYADLDLDTKTRAHFDLDVVGHYARPDVFSLSVETKPMNSVTFTA